MSGVSNGSTRLPARRLRRVGGRDPLRVAQRVALALAGVSLVWFGVSVFRPLPVVTVAPGSSPGSFDGLTEPSDQIEVRDELLASIESRGNIFNPEGNAWAVIVADTADDAEEQAEFEIASADEIDGESVAASQTTSSGAPNLTLSEAPPSAILRELQSLSLRSIYGVDGELTALIRDGSIQDTPRQTSAYRVGDKVGKAPWDLLAIDPVKKRVIVRRAGQTLEVRMFDEVAMRPAEDAEQIASDVSTAEPNAAGVVTATAAEIGDQLAREGVPLSEITALLQLAETVDMPADAPAPIVVTTTPPATGSPAASPGVAPSRAMPAEMVNLLRMMAGDAKSRSAEGETEKSGEQPKPPAAPEPESDG